MAEKTIRELIRERAEEIRHVGQIGPHRAAEVLTELSSLLSSLNSEITEHEYWYHQKVVELLKEHEKANRAEIFARACPEWKELRERQAQQKALMEMIRALKYFLRTSEEEMKESRY